jgi:antitoxin component of MazEF toxin-antitoxin module
MARKKSDGSYKSTRLARVREREAEGDKEIIVSGRKHTRVTARTGPEHAAPSATELVKTADVSDVRHVHDVTTGQRQVLTLPKDLCRRLGIRVGTPLRIVEHEGRFEVIPMRLVPASEDTSKVLAGLLAQVTPETIHGEIDTGPAVGGEAW